MEKGHVHDIANFDERFIWNEYIVRSLLDFRDRLDSQERDDLDRCQFIVRLLSNLPKRCFHISLPGISYSGLRRDFHYGTLSTSN